MSPTDSCCFRTVRMVEVFVLSWPVASPLMMRIADWLPALPPAPTSMVRKRVTTKCCLSRSWYESRMKEEVDWKMRRERSHFRRLEDSSKMDGAAAAESDDDNDDVVGSLSSSWSSGISQRSMLGLPESHRDLRASNSWLLSPWLSDLVEKRRRNCDL